MGRRKTGTILKRGSQWYIKYTINGKRVQKVTSARTKTKAQQIFNTLLSKDIDSISCCNMKLRELALRWMERRSVTLKPSTVDSYRTIINEHILPKSFLYSSRLKRPLELKRKEFYKLWW